MNPMNVSIKKKMKSGLSLSKQKVNEIKPELRGNSWEHLALN